MACRRWSCGVAAMVLALSTATKAAAQDEGFTTYPATPSEPSGFERDEERFGWYVPDFARLQTGGFQGHVNVGVGYAAFDDVLNWKLGYGYVAPGVDTDEPIHTLDTSLSVRPFELGTRRLRWVPAFLGVGVIYVPGDQYELSFPKRYEHLSESYYRPTAVHWTSHVGTELAWRPADGGFVERHAVFYQAVMMDRMARAYLDNREALDLTDAFASAIGYRMAW